MTFDTVLQVVGGATLLVIAILVAIAVVAVAANYVRDWHETAAIGRAELGARELRAKLIADSWWFSADDITLRLLQALIAGDKDVAVIRDEWRKARAATDGVELAGEIAATGKRFTEEIDAWLKANKKEPQDVRYARFPIGMVGTWMQRAIRAERLLS